MWVFFVQIFQFSRNGRKMLFWKCGPQGVIKWKFLVQIHIWSNFFIFHLVQLHLFWVFIHQNGTFWENIDFLQILNFIFWPFRNFLGCFKVIEVQNDLISDTEMILCAKQSIAQINSKLISRYPWGVISTTLYWLTGSSDKVDALHAAVPAKSTKPLFLRQTHLIFWNGTIYCCSFGRRNGQALYLQILRFQKFLQLTNGNPSFNRDLFVFFVQIYNLIHASQIDQNVRLPSSMDRTLKYLEMPFVFVAFLDDVFQLCTTHHFVRCLRCRTSLFRHVVVWKQ